MEAVREKKSRSNFGSNCLKLIIPGRSKRHDGKRQTTHKRTLTSHFLYPHFCRSFSSQPADGSPTFDLKDALYAQAKPPNGHALVRRTRSLSGTENDQNDLVPARS